MINDHDELFDFSRSDLSEIVISTIESIPHAYSIISAKDYKFLFINRAHVKLMKLFGINDSSEILGKCFWEILPTLKNSLEPLFDEVKKSGQTRFINNFQTQIFGKQVCWDIQIVPEINEKSGIVEVFIITIMDDTQSFEAEQILRDSEQMFKTLVTNIPDVISRYDKNYRYVYMSPSIVKITGMPIETFIGKTNAQLGMPAELVSVWEKSLENVFNTGKEQYTQFDFESVNGLITFEAVAAPEFSDDGSVESVLTVSRDITERKRIQEELRQTHERLKSHVENSPLVLIEWDTDFRICNWSKRAEELFGWKAEEVVGKSPYDFKFVYEEDLDKIAELMSNVTSGIHLSNVISNRNYCKNGSVKYCEWYNSALQDSSGKFKSLLSMVLDVTERKKAEQALLDNEERFRYIIKHNPSSIAVFDNNLHYILVSDRYLKDYNVKDKDIIGKHHYEVFPEIPQKWKDVHVRCLSGAVESSEEDYFVRLDGSIDYNRWECRPWRYSDGSIGGIISYNEVITERKKAEQALKASEAKYRQLYNSLKDAFVLVHLNGDIIEFNDSYREMLGYESEELVKLNYSDFTPSKWHDFEKKIIAEQLFKRGYSNVYEKEYVRKDGTVFPVELRTFLLVDDDDVPYAMWGIVRDITDRVNEKRFSEHLNNINSVINSTLDYDEILNGVVKEVTEVFGMDSGLMIERNAEFWQVKKAYKYPFDITDMHFFDEKAEYSMCAIKTKEVVFESDVTASESYTEKFGGIDVQSLLIIPLVIRGESNSVLALFSIGRKIELTQKHIDFARKIEESISLALENARLFEAEKQARAGEAYSRSFVERQFALLQEALIPKKPHICEGYSVSAAYIPAALGQEIGGDFYDIFKVEQGKFGIVVGDVSGKDLAAASLAAASRSTVCAFAYEINSPAHALEHTNAVLCARSSMDELFVTIFLAVLEPSTGELRYATAGHPPPAIYRADGSVEFLKYGSPPVGLLETTIFKESRTCLNPGDKLLIYTDGIIEARNESGSFDLEGIERMLLLYGHLKPNAVVNKLITNIKDWSDNNLSDDIAVLMIEREK